MKHERQSPSLLVVNNKPAYYRTAPYAALVEEWRRRTGGRAMVLYQARRDPHLRQEWFFTSDTDIPYPHQFISARTVKIGRRVTYLPRFGVSAFRHLEPTHFLVGGWDTPAALASVLYKKRVGGTLVAWVESNETTTKLRGGLTGRYRRAFLSAADGLMVPSQASADYAAQIVGRPMQHLKLPNPVALDRLPEGPRGGENQLLFVGDFSRRKGFDIFIDALRIGRKRGWKGHAFGTDTEGLAESSLPDNCAVTTGLHLSEIVPRLEPARDVWVIPSRVDPAPLTFSEAVALGFRTVISDSIAYAHDMEIAGVEVFPSGDPGHLLASADRVRHNARPGREESGIFTPEHWAAQTIGFFEDLGSIA